MNRPCQLLALLALVSATALASDLDVIVGEWAVDAESCGEMRLVFNFEGIHEALVAEEGRWQSMGAAEYRRHGDVIIIKAGDVEERVEILVEERDRLVLRNRESAAGDMTTELVRCPTF